MAASSARVPTHVAIIMDGNGRWATSRGKNRTAGHKEGAVRVDDIVTACVDRGVKFLTLYAFSTENWKRPKYEVTMLWRLLAQHLRTMDKKLLKNRVSLLAQGSLDRLPNFVRDELDRVVALTALESPNLYLNLCLSYGGRQEIVDACKAIATKVRDGSLALENLSEATLQQHLYHPQTPDPDLLIRTGGEYRISNFLLWEIAYSELYVTDVLWPDFVASELDVAIAEFSRRERRFGLTPAQAVIENSDQHSERAT